ncbi:hypothetical protein DFR85_04735 [Acidianus brierleyi]|uniref:Uncharacterized protein n=1 Tax=Acidianus brierleyi TaxID=41673 RepID=A0A2U9IDE9_9CREN|nr:hypothetical protein DFR85_04735 [Acidianus brierleyi]
MTNNTQEQYQYQETQHKYTTAKYTRDTSQQILLIAVKDLKTNETYIVSIIPYILQKVVEILKERGEKVEFKTKIQAYLEILPILEEEFNVVGKVFDSWYVNSKTLLEDTVRELKANARVVAGGRHVPVG